MGNDTTRGVNKWSHAENNMVVLVCWVLAQQLSADRSRRFALYNALFELFLELPPEQITRLAAICRMDSFP